MRFLVCKRQGYDSYWSRHEMKLFMSFLRLPLQFFFSDAKLQVWFSWVRSRSLHKLNQWSPQSLKKFQIQLFSLIKVCTVGVYFSQLMIHCPKHSAWKSRISPCSKFLFSPQATTMPFWSAPLGHIKHSDRTAVKCKISVHFRFSLQWIS